MLKIYGSDLSVFAIKVRMTAHCLGLEYEYNRVNLREGEQRTPEYIKMHPASKVPVIDDNGFILFESNAICKYLIEKSNPSSDLYPNDLQRKAIIDQWIDFATMHVGGGVNKIVFNRLFAPRIPVDVDERSIKDGLMFLNRYLPIIDAQLGKSPYLASDKFTLADITLLATLEPCEIADIDLAKYANITKWRSALKQQEFYTKVHKEYGEMLKQPVK